jgi:2,4-dienoyl-CoA reductase-like NADH-dependent reductase (Old Yellow Enzyme family)
MSMALQPARVGRLELRNRIVRSATAERLAAPQTGAPLPGLADQYLALARGGVAVIVTGHTYVHRRGKVNAWMASSADDSVVSAWRQAIGPAQQAGARVIMQLNFAGAATDPQTTPDPLSPSGVPVAPGRRSEAMSEAQIQMVLAAFAQAARRAREAGCDGIQLHAAHGYAACQFLTPSTNTRDDAWGGDAPRRRAFLLAMIAAVRAQVGPDYPLWLKLGVAGSGSSGLRAAEGAAAAAAAAAAGVDCIEISHGLGRPEQLDQRHEAEYGPLAASVRAQVAADYPLALVSGFRSLSGMEQVLGGGLVQLVSLCRPLIAEPDLVRRLEADGGYTALCTRCDRCRPTPPHVTVECRNLQVLARRDRGHAGDRAG